MFTEDPIPRSRAKASLDLLRKYSPLQVTGRVTYRLDTSLCGNDIYCLVCSTRSDGRESLTARPYTPALPPLMGMHTIRWRSGATDSGQIPCLPMLGLRQCALFPFPACWGCRIVHRSLAISMALAAVPGACDGLQRCTDLSSVQRRARPPSEAALGLRQCALSPFPAC